MEEITEVATAVPYSPDKERFLIGKKSKMMNIHQGKWNFPSRKIEGETPKDVVLRGLKEATDLLGETIRSGESFTVDTEDGRFNIHPFLVKIGSEPDPGSKFSEYRWIKPDDIDELETVKGLKKDLRHVGVLDE